MSTGLVDQEVAHPLVRQLDLLEAAFDEGAEAPAWTLTPNQIRDLLLRTPKLRNMFDALELTLLREADRHQIGDPVGAANTAGWWATETRMTKPAAHQAVALAAQLDDDQHAPVRTALAAGAVAREQAAVIIQAIEALPTSLVGPALRRDAEKHLVALAEHHDPRELRILGRRILDVIAPEISEEHERQVLEREEQHAAATASFTMNPDGHGSMIGRFKIPVLAGEMLRKHLNAIAAPRHQQHVSTGSTSDGGKVARPLRLGQAFIEYLETRPDTAAPKAGGIAATIVVTMTLESLLGADAAATLDSGERISAAEARRLACEAGIIPAVLGRKSQPLDIGRKARFHTEPQRIALMLHHKGCAAENCDWPPSMCHAHHLKLWSQGGLTSVDNGILLCPHHHALAHDARYQLKSGPNGKVTFSKRT